MGTIKFSDIRQCPISMFKHGQGYQRNISQHRFFEIKRRVKAFGYDPFSIIIVNSSYDVIDGQHRIEVAKSLGIETLPTCIVECTPTEEAILFKRINDGHQTKLSPIDRWHVNNEIGVPLAKLLYFLHDDSRSLLYQRIAVKGHQTSETKFPIQAIIDLIGTIVFGIPDPCGYGSREERYNKAAGTVSQQDVLFHINRFMDWFYLAFGKNKAINRRPFESISLRAISAFYVKLLHTGIAEDRPVTWRNSSLKMGKFIFTWDWTKIGPAARLNMLINHWNQRQTKYMISYDTPKQDPKDRTDKNV